MLISPRIPLPECVSETTLSFNYLLDTRDTLTNDFVDVRIDDGTSITTVLSRTGGTLPETGPGWSSATVDLSSYAGKQIRVLFSFRVIGPEAIDPEGWYVDDVVVTAVPKAVCGYKWLDDNPNGTWDPGEPGLNGHRIYVDLNNNGQWDHGQPGTNDEPSAVTQNDGKHDGAYWFDDLPPGTHALREVPSSNWKQTYPRGPDLHSVTVVLGEAVVGRFEAAELPNFGNAEVNISGYKWHDGDGDGAWDTSDSPLAGWEIRAYRDENGNQQLDQNEFNNGATDSDITDSAGRFDLAVGAGKFVVLEVLKDRWKETFPTTPVFASGLNTGSVVFAPNGYALQLNLHETADGTSGIAELPNFGNFEMVSLAGSKFNDVDGDGTDDGGADPPLAGWTIQLDLNSDGTVDRTTVTGAEGKYEFADAGPGTHKICQVVPSGWIVTRPTSGCYTVTTQSGQNRSDLDFGDFQLVKLGGEKFEDLDGDGTKDAGEGPLAGWTIQLDLNSDGTVDRTTVTGAEGKYEFADAGPGTHKICQVVPSGWIVTRPTSGCYTVTTQSGQNRSDLDFGDFQLVKLGGEKFEDLDGDGTKDAGEGPLAGWTIQLDLSSDGTVDRTTVTGAEGKYEFADAGPGTHKICQVVPSGWIVTRPTSGCYTVTTQSGQNRSDLDFGDFQLVKLGGEKFEDLDGDGTKDAGEGPLAGWTIQLDLNSDGTVDRTTVTGAEGKYEFADAGPGTHKICQVVPSGWIVTRPTSGCYTVTTQSGQNRSDLDFGDFQLVKLGGEKFEDLDGDGTKDAGEGPLAGWTIQLDLNSDGTVDRTTVTGAEGKYEFADVGPGTHKICQVVPSGWIVTRPTSGCYTVTTQSGQNRSDLDFGDFQLVKLGGEKFEDLDGDGTKDAGEGPLAGWTIQLDLNSDGTVDRTTVTGAEGKYEFADAGPGTHKICQVVPSGWIVTRPTSGCYTVTTQSGQNRSDLDFGDFQLVKLGGEKFEDLDGDGTKDAGEGPLAGWTIQLDLNSDGTVDRTTVTGAEGKYEFADAGPGTHKICQVVPSGWIVTRPTSGCYTVTTQSGQNRSDLDFGDFQLVKLGGEKFEDLDGDGTKDAGEGPLAGWTIQLDLSSDGTVDRTTVTGAEGKYEFADVGPGTHKICQVVPSGWIVTRPTSGCYTVTTQSGQNRSDLDFGDFQLVKLGGEKFEDLDGDGTKDAGEGPLAGWTIQLDLSSDGTVDRTTVTGAEGKYEFADVGPGTHKICQVVPSGWIVTRPTSGCYTVTTQSGQNRSDLDFGDFQLVKLGGEKFEDLDGDGTKDAGEGPLAGWTIQLDLSSDGTVDRTTVTGAEGKYEFADAGPGTHKICQVVPSGWIVTRPTSGCYTVTTQSGQNRSDLDFGDFQLVKLGGEKFEDLDGDGTKDAGEGPLAGWTIQLDLNSDGTVDRTTVTGAEGKYEFADAGPGTHKICQVVPSGWIVTRPTSGCYTVTTQSGQNRSDLDFGDFQLVKLGGEKFEDLDGDGTKDAGEGPLAGWTIQLDLNSDGTVDRTTVTGAEGKYEFADAGPGTHKLSEVLQTGWHQTSPQPVPPGTHMVTARSGQDELGLDFGNTFNRESQLIQFITPMSVYRLDGPFVRPPDSQIGIAGYVWHDQDNDGQWDCEEPGLNGWIIYVDTNDNNVRDVGEPAFATTNDGTHDGAFWFTVQNLNLDHVDSPTGTFILREDLPSGLTQSYPGSPDFEYRVSVDLRKPISERYGESLGRFGVTEKPNFGNPVNNPGTKASISGYKWHDLNQNGQWDVNEPGRYGWLIFLDENNDGEFDRDLSHSPSPALTESTRFPIWSRARIRSARTIAGCPTERSSSSGFRVATSTL